MSAVTYPSSLFPARPAFTVTPADGWDPQIVEGTEFALTRTTENGEGFAPTLTVNIYRVPGTSPIGDIAPTFIEGVAGLPNAAIYRQEACEVLGGPGASFEATFTGPGSLALFQLVRLAAVEHGSWTDIVSFIGCGEVAQADDLVSEIRGMLDSIRRTD